MRKLIWIWLREDDEAPSVLQKGTRPSGPGDVYEVRAQTRAEATRLVRWALMPEPNPDNEAEREKWLNHRKGKDRVRKVSEEDYHG